MSNQVRELYLSVIETVMKEVRTEFEETGDDPFVLHMLKNAWKKRLMDMNITKKPLWPEAVPEDGRFDAAASHNNIPDGIHPPNDADAMLFAMHNKPRFGESEPNPTRPTALTQPFDILAGASAASGEGVSGNSVDSNVTNIKVEPYNPLDSSKLGKEALSLSPELQSQLQNAMNKGSQYPSVPQHDGNQEDELNSDLDDSEDELNSNDDEEDNEQTQLMVCLYEKVHKVKTRWKYTLKDGIANVNGLDYVFTKATGESEW